MLTSFFIFSLWKRIYFGNHIRTLCSWFVVVLAMVTLAVIYFGDLKNCSVT